jgi:hypothetical protein
VIFSTHWRIDRRSTEKPFARHSSTSSFASTAHRSGLQFTGISLS